MPIKYGYILIKEIEYIDCGLYFKELPSVDNTIWKSDEIPLPGTYGRLLGLQAIVNRLHPDEVEGDDQAFGRFGHIHSSWIKSNTEPHR